jgi:hypothetical protein
MNKHRNKSNMAQSGCGAGGWLVVITICLTPFALPTNAQDPAATDTESQSGQIDSLLEGLDLETPAPVVIPDASQAAPADAAQRQDPAGGASLLAAFRSMQTASDLMGSGRADQTVVAAQQRAVDLLDQLIRQSQGDQGSGAASQSESEQTAGQQESTSTQPENSTASDPQEATDPQASDSQSSTADDQTEGGSPSDAEQGQEEGESDSSSQGAGRGQGSAADPTMDRQSVSAAAGAGPLNAQGQGVWGHLPQKTRGLLRAEIPTEYLPKYSRQISDYFKALAEMPGDR